MSLTARVRDRPSRAVAAFVVAAIVAVVAVGVLTADKGGDTTGDETDLIGLPEGPTMAVGVTNEIFVDESRATPAQGPDPERTFRRLVTTIYYPVNGVPGGRPLSDASPLRQAFPLVIFSHGFGLTGRSASVLASYWAGNGYVVVAPDYPLTSADAPGGPQRSDDVRNQPGDASFVLTETLRVTADPTHRLHGIVDPSQVAAAGYSMGGGVTLGAGFNSCCRDARIKAAVVLAGAQPALPGEYFTGPPVPVLFVHGDVDATVPYERGRQMFAEAQSPKLLVTILHGDHGTPYTGDVRQPDSALVAAVTTAFLDGHLKGRSDAVHKLKEEVANQFYVAKLEEG